MTVALYPGSFDPITLGHIDIARRSAGIFDRLIVAVFDTPSKSLLFTTAERIEMAAKALAPLANVEVAAYDELTVNFARKVGAKTIVRGLRAVSDFEVELQMALMDHTLAPEIERVFFMTSSEYSFLSASLIKEIIKLGGPWEGLVPEHVAEALRQKYASQREAPPVPRWLTS